MPQTNQVNRTAHTTRRLAKWELNDLEHCFSKGNMSVYRDYDYQRKYTAFAIVHHRDTHSYKVGTLLLTKDTEGYRVYYMAISRKYQGIGVAEWLYGSLLKSGVVLVSGTSQSPGAKKLWAKLMEKFSSNLEPEELDTHRKVCLWA
jgi:GNAT superfamily N-acetyltransferase